MYCVEVMAWAPQPSKKKEHDNNFVKPQALDLFPVPFKRLSWTPLQLTLDILACA